MSSNWKDENIYENQNRNDKHTLRYVGIIVFIVLLCGYVGGWDGEAEMEEQRIYIENVCSGAWGDYKQLEPDCE